jgi:hypothetical protein
LIDIGNQMNLAATTESDSGNANMRGGLASAQRDMRQVQTLLTDAVDQLIADACAIRSASRLQQSMAGGGDADWGKSLALSHEIDQRADSALRHLQFQDMVSQLIEHVQNKLALLAEDPPGRNSSNMNLDHATAVQPLPGAHQGMHKPVAATSLHEGAVELFY